jgi:AraC-like DNA-binding protein
VESNPRWVDLESSLGVTSRTMRRWMDRHTGWFGGFQDFRAQIQYWRLSSAAMLLSSPENTISQVARAVGYGTDRALLRAMGDAGLPQPRLIREAYGHKG